MKPFKRSNYRKQTTDAINSYYCGGESETDEFKTDESKIDESEIVETQISQAWKRREQEERIRIQRETDLAWAEYQAKNNVDDFENGDYTIVVEEYFQNTEDIDEPEVSEFLYQKNQKRGIRRRKTAYAKNRLMQKSKAAMKNSAKRKEDDSKNHMKISKKNPRKDENDLKNLRLNSNREFKSRVARLITLRKRVKNNVV